QGKAELESTNLSCHQDAFQNKLQGEPHGQAKDGFAQHHTGPPVERQPRYGHWTKRVEESGENDRERRLDARWKGRAGKEGSEAHYSSDAQTNQRAAKNHVLENRQH